VSFVAFSFVATIYVTTAYAQYPNVPADVREEAARKKEAMDRHSDQAWEKALPVIKEWEAKGKPYIPWAAKPDDLPQAPIPAFPGAQGGGMYSFGGRGGKVFVVTNLNDRGPGSFREALEAGGPRIVVFNVAGIIKLEERIRVRAPYITIAGSTAPGDGVCIAGDTVELETHDVIIRHMRFRRGATWVGDRNDSIGGNPIGNIMIDHVSASWGLDENMSMYRHMYSPPNGGKDLKLPTVNITIQNSIFSEALDTYNHSFGSTIGGYNSTFHHNLWADNTGRNPSVGMIYDFTFVNNVIYNWVHRTTDGGGPGSFYSMINNYYKPGPVTPMGNSIRYRIIKPDGRLTQQGEPRFGKVYASGNVVEGNEAVTKDNWAGGVQVDEQDGHDPKIVLPLIRQDKPYPHAYIDIESAKDAYQTVLAGVGARLPKRDAVDERIIEQVRTGRIKASPQVDPNSLYQFEHRRLGRDSYLKGIITDIRLVRGYPEYKGIPYKDTDGDGMPDEWESKYGLDPEDASDASGDLNGDGYTNIEDFINGLAPNAPKVEWKTPRTFIDIWKDAG
jgi:pectate lyase